VSAQIGPTAQESAGVSANVSPTPRQNAGVERRVDLVFEGGGVKGVALAGAYLELSERGYTPECVAGTSAGAITAALVAVGYSGAELEDIVLGQMHFPSFEDQTFLDRLGPPGEFAEFIARGGIHSGDFFLSWIRKLLAAKGKTKFGDLRSPSGEGGNRAYALQVITSDLTDRSMLVLPRDRRAEAPRHGGRARDRRRRDPVELPNLAVRRPRLRSAALSHLRDDARRARTGRARAPDGGAW
jgi:predicted acylesterase/phospholipase RssA